MKKRGFGCPCNYEKCTWHHLNKRIKLAVWQGGKSCSLSFGQLLSRKKENIVDRLPSLLGESLRMIVYIYYFFYADVFPLHLAPTIPSMARLKVQLQNRHSSLTWSRRNYCNSTAHVCKYNGMHTLCKVHYNYCCTSLYKCGVAWMLFGSLY